MQTYRVFGLTLASDFVFKSGLVPGSGAPDLTFRCVAVAPVLQVSPAPEPAYVSPYVAEDGQSVAGFYRFAEYDLLRFNRIADFYLWPDRIVCHLLDDSAFHHIERRLLGSVLALWLERRGTPALHASAAVVDGRAAVFISASQSGKSGLAAALVRNGCPLLTDDILAVTEQNGAFSGQPAYRTMRLWPDQARFFFGADFDRLERVYPAQEKRHIPLGPGGLGGICETAVPLGCVYVPQRRDPKRYGTAVEFETIPALDAVIELVRHSFAAAVGALGWQPQRLELFARLVHRVPAFSLAYPNGFEHFPAVAEEVRHHLSNIVPGDG